VLVVGRVSATVPTASKNGEVLDSGNSGGPILVLDESPEIASLIEFVLREQGFAVQSATSNEEALKKAELEMPSLVLLDVGLAPTTDEVFVAALHEMYGPRVPIIVVSAVCEPAFQSAVRRTGAIDAIRKPFDISDLLVGVQRAVNGFRDSPPAPSAAFAM
jgi:DNA-binding response OmpR family regulator